MAKGIPKKTSPIKKSTAKKSVAGQAAAKKVAAPVLLSGGNPQVAMGYGDEPVQVYICAMPGWKSAVGQQIDEIITRSVPGVRKAIKWNSPMYGIPGQGWFVSVHCMTKYIKIAFFKGSLLKPMPPVESKERFARYYHVYEDKPLDEKQFADWVTQASRNPGWVTSDIA